MEPAYWSGDSLRKGDSAAVHLHILAILPDYVTAVLLGQPLTAALREVEAHLEGCASCRAESEALRSALEALYGHEAVSFPEPPVPDLSFLRIPPAPLGALASAASGIQSAVARIRDAIAIQFSEALLTFMRPPALARAIGLRLRYAYTVPQTSDDDPHITVEVLAPNERDEEDGADLRRIARRRPFRPGWQHGVPGDRRTELPRRNRPYRPGAFYQRATR